MHTDTQVMARRNLGRLRVHLYTEHMTGCHTYCTAKKSFTESRYSSKEQQKVMATSTLALRY